MRKTVLVLMAAALVHPGFAAEKPRKKGTRTKERTVKMLVTAYCPCRVCCGPQAHGVTSTGDNAWVLDGVAADPRLIPYRTRLRIPGVGVREVDDTGGAMRQSAKRGIYHIDVRFTSHAEAKRFGRKWLKIKILKGGNT